MGPRSIFVRLGTLTLCAAVLGSGCAAKSVATSGDTLAAARKTLQGTWALTSLDVTTPDRRTASVEAAGTLVSDAFGNLAIEYRVSPAGQKTMAGVGIPSPNPVIATAGRVVIDVDQRRITYVSEKGDAKPFDAELTARRNNPFALEHPRYYAVGADGLLSLTTRYDDGTDASVSRWKRSSN